MNKFKSFSLIGLILISGVILRAFSLNQSLWLDEASTALAAKMSVIDLFTKYLPGDFHPPLYYLLIKYWTVIFGNSEISLRTPSIFFSVGTIYITFLIAKKIFDKKTGLIAALLLATSGLSIYYSQEARMYSLVMFLVASSVYNFLTRNWKLFALGLLGIGLTDYVSLFMVPVFWYFGFKNKKFLLANTLVAAGLLLWLPIFYKQLISGIAVKSASPIWWQLIGTSSLKNILLIPAKFIFGRISVDNNFIYGTAVLAVFVLFGYLLVKAAKVSRLIWFWFIVPILIAILVSFKIPTLSYFRFLFCLPAFYILIAKGIGKSGVLLIVVLAVNVLSSFYYLSTPKFWREDWRTATKTIGREDIVLPADSQREALIYYGKVNNVTLFSNFKGEQETLWLSRYVWELFDRHDSARKKIEALGYNKVAEYSFNGVVFWKYSK